MGQEAVDWKSIPHKAPARPEERLLLRVEMAGRGGLVASQRVPAGTHHVIVYRSELDAVRKQCATQGQLQMYALAKSTYEAKLEAELASVKDEKSKARIAASFAISPESEYHAMRGEKSGDRGVPTLRKVDVVGDVPPPDMPVTRAMAAQDQIAEVVKQLAGMPEAIRDGIRDAMVAIGTHTVAQVNQQQKR